MIRPSYATSAFFACLIEATARKAGNVHPYASFENMSFAEFLEVSHRSAGDAEPSKWLLAVGAAGRDGPRNVAATKRAISVNTNLGTILLFAPFDQSLPYISSEQGFSDRGEASIFETDKEFMIAMLHWT